MESALRTCIAVVGGCQVAGMFISYGLRLDKITAFHRKLREIIDDSSHGNQMSTIFYNRQCI